LLFPGNEADNQDVWGIYWDVSADEISLKTYDDSGDSWSEQSISGSMVAVSTYIHMDGAIRFSDGHLIFAAWNLYDDAAADLMVWDINGAGSITAKTNVITNTSEYTRCSVFINQDNDDIYIAYIGGTTNASLVAARYQKSDDGGASWSGDTLFQADAEDDERWISCGAVKAVWGGKFQPVWFNDDLNDLFTNTDNGISIAAADDGNVTVTPTTLALATTKYIPILKEVITPNILALGITVYVPVLKEVITLTTLALVTAGHIPSINVGTRIVPSTLALTMLGYAPILKEVLTPSTLALLLMGYIPVIAIPAVHRNVADDFWEWFYEPPVKVTITPIPDEIQFKERK